MPGSRGRPRGSGRVQIIPAVELTQSEYIPYAVGFRLADGFDVTAAEAPPPLEWFHVRTTAAERRDLATLPRQTVDMWIMIGAMQRWLEQAITRARRA